MMQVTEWEDNEGLMAGFPCQPESMQGKHKLGRRDTRLHVLMSILTDVKHLP